MSEQALALRPTNLQEIFQLGQLFAAALAGDKGAVASVKVLAGRELGIPAIVALTGIHFYDGAFSLGSHLLAGAIRASGRYDFRLLEHNDTVCCVQFSRKQPDGSWMDLQPAERLTLEEAVNKGWTGKKPAWAKTPKNLLFARCLTNGYKFHCPDLFSGLLVYDQDELEPTAPVVEASYTVSQPPTNGHVEPPQSVPEESQANPPVAPQLPEQLTEAEVANLVALARQHQRTTGEVSAILAVLGVPILDKAPRSRLFWLQIALTAGLVGKDLVGKIEALINHLKLDWALIPGRLQASYGVTALAHLLPAQALEVYAKLQETQARQLQPAG